MVDMPKRVNKSGQEEGLRVPGKNSLHTGQRGKGCVVEYGSKREEKNYLFSL